MSNETKVRVTRDVNMRLKALATLHGLDSMNDLIKIFLDLHATLVASLGDEKLVKTIEHCIEGNHLAGALAKSEYARVLLAELMSRPGEIPATLNITGATIKDSNVVIGVDIIVPESTVPLGEAT